MIISRAKTIGFSEKMLVCFVRRPGRPEEVLSGGVVEMSEAEMLKMSCVDASVRESTSDAARELSDTVTDEDSKLIPCAAENPVHKHTTVASASVSLLLVDNPTRIAYKKRESVSK